MSGLATQGSEIALIGEVVDLQHMRTPARAARTDQLAGLLPWLGVTGLLLVVGAGVTLAVVDRRSKNWEGDTCWIMTGTGSVKATNVAANPKIAMHWQVTEAGDGVEVWGTAELFTDIDTKRRLWDDVFDYDLNAFAPGGPDDSPDTGFLAVTVERALIIKQYGMGGLQRWTSQ